VFFFKESHRSVARAVKNRPSLHYVPTKTTVSQLTTPFNLSPYHGDITQICNQQKNNYWCISIREHFFPCMLKNSSGLYHSQFPSLFPPPLISVFIFPLSKPVFPGRKVMVKTRNIVQHLFALWHCYQTLGFYLPH